MSAQRDLSNFSKELLEHENLLIIQDIDGVCIPLVKDPINREIEANYVHAVSRLNNEFFVLTCGEHEGRRGVNRIIERSLMHKSIARKNGLYLPGLAACGIEYQDKYGNIELLGINKAEDLFLSNISTQIRNILNLKLKQILPSLTIQEIEIQTVRAVCDTRFSPAINLNGLFTIINDTNKRRELQLIVLEVMEEIVKHASSSGLNESFHLHISPNLGIEKGKEIIKLASTSDIGTTDIQLIINGALKEAGLLVLINKYIGKKTGKSPLGEKFNVREAPKNKKDLISYCRNHINKEDMPTIIGVGDTVTSIIKENTNTRLRGGSDRGFLTFIKEIGKEYKSDNRVIFVSSGNKEVYRPSPKGKDMAGISDPEDPLKFDIIMLDGPKEYIKWLIDFSTKRSEIK